MLTELIAGSGSSAQRAIFVIILGLSITSCFFRARPIYYDTEQAVAERAVSRFHDLHNQGKPEAIYELMDKTGHNDEIRVKTLNEIRIGFETVGKVLASTLVEKKIFPNPSQGCTSQVKMTYDTTFEKRRLTELFAWNIRNSSEAILVEYRIIPSTN